MAFALIALAIAFGSVLVASLLMRRGTQIGSMTLFALVLFALGTSLITPLIPLYQQANTVAYAAALQGVRQNPSTAEVFWNSGEWSLEG